LIIMVRAYRRLGVNDLADSAMRVLQLNYPENPAIDWLNDPRGYEIAKKGTGFWAGLKFWGQEESTETETVVKEKQPAFWESWKPWAPDTEAAETADKKQEPSGWQGWQQKKAAPAPVPAPAPAPVEVEVEVEPVPAPQEENGEDAETAPEGSNKEPGFWEDLKFWEADPEDTETPEADDGEEEPAFWEDWKFWEEEPEEAPAEK